MSNTLIDPRDYTPEQRAVVERVAEKLPAFLPVNDEDVPRPHYMRTRIPPRWMLGEHGPQLWAKGDVDDWWYPVYPDMTWWEEKNAGVSLSPLGDQFHIHLYPMIRVRINGCWGWGGADALRRAGDAYRYWFSDRFNQAYQIPQNGNDWDSCKPGVVHVEFADELVPQALLDVAGDKEHEQTTHWDLVEEGWVRVQVK